MTKLFQQIFQGVPWLFEMVQYGMANDGFQLSFTVNLITDAWNLVSVSRYGRLVKIQRRVLGPTDLTLLGGKTKNHQQPQENCDEKRTQKLSLSKSLILLWNLTFLNTEKNVTNIDFCQAKPKLSLAVFLISPTHPAPPHWDWLHLDLKLRASF